MKRLLFFLLVLCAVGASAQTRVVGAATSSPLSTFTSPSYTVGSNLVSNSAFATAASWTGGTGWILTAGHATHSVGTAALTQTITVPDGSNTWNGNFYLVTVAQTGGTAGSIVVSFNGATWAVPTFAYNVNTPALLESYDVAGSVTLTVTPSNNYDAALTSISVQLVTYTSGMTMGTADQVYGNFFAGWGAGGSTAPTAGDGSAGSGGGNTAIGNGAFVMNILGTDNTVFGNSAMPFNVKGDYNTAIGQGALGSNTASSNTAVGLMALSSNTTGTNNTGLGINTLANNTTGVNNTAVGHGSGPDVSTPALVNTTAVGYGAIPAVSNQAVIGNTSVTQMCYSGTSICLFKGAGVPSGGLCVSGNIGSVYSNTSGGANTSLYGCTAAGVWSPILNSVPTRYATTSCQPGLGDGKNAIAAGTYPQAACYNDTGATITITGIKCYTDNTGSSTLAVTNGAGTALLTGPVTCSTAFAAGTQSGTVTLAAGDVYKFSFISDGTTKTSTWVVSETY